MIFADTAFLSDEFSRKFSDEKTIDAFYAAFVFKENNPVRTLLHKLKYDGKFKAGIFLGEETAKRFRDEIARFEPDLIIPVPLHKLKKAERGYNQAFYIAKGISRETGVKVARNVLVRIKYTETQTHLSAKERKQNVANAFSVKKRAAGKLAAANVILVDDVSTTGATTLAAARELKRAGARKILLLTAAVPEIA